MTTLALYGNKGGVGKTAAAVNLAYLAAQSGRPTLICDLDPQSSATFYFRVKPKLKRKARGFQRGGKPIFRSIKGTDYDNLDLLPADVTHRNLGITFNQLSRRKHRLDMVLKPLRNEYDYIFLDCPPTINILAENIFNAADVLLVPLMPTVLSSRAHTILLDFLKSNKYMVEEVYGYFSIVNRHNKMHRQMGLAMFTEFKNILQNPIPYDPHVEQMGIYREPVPAFSPESPAAQAYRSLWTEIQKKVLQQR
jgi:cellulose biosynthesis protein BcsQ